MNLDRPVVDHLRCGVLLPERIPAARPEARRGPVTLALADVLARLFYFTLGPRLPGRATGRAAAAR